MNQNKPLALATVPAGRILYLSDRYGISSGYEPVFAKLLGRLGIPRQRVIVANIYGLVETALVKKGTEKTWRFNPDRKDEIRAAVDQRIMATKPVLIVCADPAALGLFVNFDSRVATLDKCRGGRYNYHGIPVVVTYPITVIHTHIDEKLIQDFEGESVSHEPYKVPQGSWILNRDWEKIARVFHGRERNLPRFQYSICRTLDDCFAARDFLADCRAMSCDIETGTYPAQITCVGYAGIHKLTGEVRAFVIPFVDEYQENGAHWDSEDDHAIAYNVMCEINKFPIAKFMQNGSYDSAYFIKYRAGIRDFLVDTMLMWYALYMELPKSLDFVSSILLDNFQYWKDDIKGDDNESLGATQSTERYWRYNALDCYYTLFNGVALLELLHSNQTMQFNYRDVFMRAMSGLRMSMRGVRADFAKREEHRERLESESEIAMRRLRYIIDEPDFNVQSPAQKMSLFYDVLGARERTAKGRMVNPSRPRIGTNAPSSGAIAMKMIKTEHPVYRYVLDRVEDTMTPLKQISNVCNMRLFTDRFRTNYAAAGTTSTRFSSRGSSFWDGGNAQNIRDSMRDWLVADEGCILLDVDYSQSDDVFVGYESNDPEKIRVIESGVDGHAVHGELFFKRTYDSIVAGKRAGDPDIVHPVKGIRQIAKRVVHGTNFQMAAITLFMTMGRDAVVAAGILLGYKDADSWDQDRLIKLCQALMNLYRKKYRRLNRDEWYKDIAIALATKGTLTNAFGITRRFLGDPRDNGTQREATGFIGQSDTAGNMNRSMYEIDFGFIPERFRDGLNPDAKAQPMRMDLESHGFRFLLQTHDSFTAQLSLTHPRWREAAINLLNVMERPIIINGHTVRVKTEAAVGLRWGKKMLEWSSRDPYDLDRVVSTAMKGT